MKVASIFSSLAILFSLSNARLPPRSSAPRVVSNIPGTIANETSIAKFISSQYGLDGPKVAPLNLTATDWWYFDCVSSDLKGSFVILFLMEEAAIGDGTHDLLVNLVATFPNGTAFATGALGTSAIVVTEDQGSSGEYVGTGAQWKGAPDMSRYEVLINSEEMGISGKMTLHSAAPAHYPCGPVEAGQNMEVVPHLGWANAVPDAFADVDFIIQGSPLSFTGVGYHDKNWADAPSSNYVNSWYWGHGRLGDYSIVWFNIITPAGETFTSGYVSQDGKIRGAQCTGIEVRPTGQNDTYPPTATSGWPSGYKIKIDLGDEGLLVAEAVNEATIADYGIYARFKGVFSGTLNGEALPDGVALYEELINLVGA